MLLFAVQEFGRPYIAPPGLPAPVAEALRQSFMATMKDPAFLAEAQRRGLDIDPTPGEEIDALVRRLYETLAPNRSAGAGNFAGQVTPPDQARADSDFASHIS